MVNKNLHVVVTLTEATRKSTANDDLPYDTEVKVLDSQSLLLRLTKTSKNNAPLRRYYRQLEFDAVGFEYEPHIRTEISLIMDNLFKCKENCSMIRIAPQRTMNMNLLTRFLIAEIDKTMLELRYRMTSIRLEYYDIRKFDMVNMLSLAPSHGNASLATNANQSNGKTRRRKRQSYNAECKVMQNTRELFQWLLTEYTILRTRGTGDDYMDLEFQFNDKNQKKHIVHFSLFQIFTIAPDTRSDLMRFFKSIGSSKKSQPTLITDCLKESFDLTSHSRTLLWFEVPMNRESKFCIKNMFKLADAAYFYINLARIEKEDKENKELQELPKADTIKFLNNSNVLQSLSKTSNSSNASKCSPRQTRSSLARIKMNSGAAAANKAMLNNTFYGDNDYNTLSYWYNRIDQVIILVYQAMDNFYSALYRNKAHRICEEIKLIGNEESGGDNNGPNNAPPTDDEEQARAAYSGALSQFRRLDQEVEKSSYAETLKVYLSTKSYELTQAEEKHKQKELANLRSSVINYVRLESKIAA